MRLRACLLAVLLCQLALHATAADGPEFVPVVLPGENAQAYDINNRGDIVGVIRIGSAAFEAVRWEDGLVRLLGLNSGSEAFGINERGEIVGRMGWPCGMPFLWRNGNVVPLRTLVDDECSGGGAFKINNKGQITGWLRSPEGGDHAVRWDDGAPIDLGSPDSAAESFGYDLNERGDVVGQSYFANGAPRAFLWSDGRFADLGDPMQHTSGEFYSINNRRETAGYIAVGPSFAISWWRGVVVQLSEPANASGYQINERGEVAGESGGRAMLWRDEAAVVLPSPDGAARCAALGLSDAGEPVGYCVSRPVVPGPEQSNAVVWLKTR